MDEFDYFRAALKYILKERGGQSNLALDSHVSDGYISQILAGTRSNPSRKIVKRIALALKTTYLEMIALGKSILEKDFPDRVTERQESYIVAKPGREDKYRIFAEVGEILDSGNVDIINDLVKDIREFRRAVGISQKLTSCLEQIDAMQKQINDLSQKVEGLTATPAGADASEASSGKGGT